MARALLKDRSEERRRLESQSYENTKREIKELITQDGCPICNVCNEHLKRSWFWFFSESYAEGSGVSEYIGNWGFCEEHTKMVAQAGPIWQKSVIYSWTINRQLPALEQFLKTLEETRDKVNYVNKPILRRRLKKDIERIIPSDECLFCKREFETASHYASELLKVIEDEEIRTMYEKSSGLCMQHFFKVVNEFDILEHTPQILELVKVQISKLGELKADFDEFFRKSDYRYSLEPKGKEQTTWLRAIKFIAGRTRRTETGDVSSK